MTTIAAPAEPACPGADGDLCDGTMVHNSWSGEWECAGAFFALNDNGVLADGFLVGDEDDLGEWDRRFLDHWRTHRVPDDR